MQVGLLFLFGLLVEAYPLSYPLSDIQYPVPTCNPAAGLSTVNNFGSLLVENDLLATQLQLHVLPDSSQSSCRFCRISPSYCNTPFGNGTNLHLAYDTSYNMRVITLDAQNLTLTSLSIAVPPPSSSLVLERPYQICGNTYRLVLMVIMEAEAPLVRDFLLIARDSSTSATLPCSIQPSQADITCSITRNYFYLDYQVSNCVSSGLQGRISPQSDHSFVHYYYEAIVRGDSSILQGNLCGESWLSIYRRAGLEKYCDPDNMVYIEMKPWYRAALQAIAAWANGRRDTPVWLVLEGLEKYCLGREVVLDLFHNMTLLLGDADNRDVEADWALLCEGSIVENHANITLPFYFYHYREWYFESFRFLIYYDEWMPAKSVLLVAFIILSGLVISGAISLTTVLVGRSLRQKYANYDMV
jgi:hypothetical protein